MAETVAGGVYQDPDSKTYHDAEGNPVADSGTVNDAKRLSKLQSDQKLADYTPLITADTQNLAQALQNLARGSSGESKPTPPKGA